jgi:hypothetical protein
MNRSNNLPRSASEEVHYFLLVAPIFVDSEMRLP